MLEVSELRHVLQIIEQNGNPGLSLMRLKTESGMSARKLSQFMKKHTQIFRLTENGQMIEINKDVEHQGNHDAILKAYEEHKTQKKRMIILIIATVAFILIAGNGIGYLIGQRL